MTVSPTLAGGLSTTSLTSRPTIISASSPSEVCGEVVPTTLPRRMTLILSPTAFTSRSLWVMKMIEVPCAFSERMMSISSSISCGVRTAVGSSRISTLASLERALMISTRCCTPTGSSPTSLSGSTCSPNRSERSRTFSAALRRLSTPGREVCSWPSITFSATVKTGTSMKCWWTMPMPAAMASPGELKVTGFPSTTISPSDGASSP